jgi:uncharacterized protein (TIGR02466 family)
LPPIVRPPPPAEVQPLLQALNAGQPERAEAGARAALLRYPQAPVLHSILASALAAQQKWVAALDGYTRLEQLTGPSFELHCQLAQLNAQCNRPDEAVRRYRQALTLQPTHAELQLNVGMLLSGIGRHAEAAESYARALAIKPSLTMAHYNHGTALQALGRWDDAADAYRRAVAARPDHAASHGNLGAVLQAKGDLGAAVESYQRALAIGPHPLLHFNLGTAYRNQGRLEMAVTSFEAALAMQSAYPDAWNNLGEVLRDQGRFDDAVACFERALQQSADTAEAHYNLGTVLVDGGRFDQAIPHFRQSALRDWHDRVLLCLYKGGRPDAFHLELQQRLREESGHRAPLLANLSAHHAASLGVPDDCRFCPNPMDFVHHGRIDELAAPGSDLLAALIHDVASAEIAARRQGRLHHGEQSAGNLFKRPEASFRTLAALVTDAVARYRQHHAGAACVYASEFPKEIAFSSSWFVKMRTGGHLTSHIHETGWLSGVLYLAMPPRSAGSQEGCIEFSTDGDGYPKPHDRFPVQVVSPAVGDIVLFPSSLFHRTIPFSAAQDRICIAFDVAPAVTAR